MNSKDKGKGKGKGHASRDPELAAWKCKLIPAIVSRGFTEEEAKRALKVHSSVDAAVRRLQLLHDIVGTDFSFDEWLFGLHFTHDWADVMQRRWQRLGSPAADGIVARGSARTFGVLVVDGALQLAEGEPGEAGFPLKFFRTCQKRFAEEEVERALGATNCSGIEESVKWLQARCPLLSVDPYLDAEATSERFELGDPRAIEHLSEFGYVVFRGVASGCECARAQQLLFEFMHEHARWEQDDPSTWNLDSFPITVAKGLVNSRGAGQSELSWYVRTLPRIREIFEHVWGSSELLTSYDGFGLFRPWHSELQFPKTEGGWFHVDQSSPGRQCVQGLLSIFDQDHTTGGLTVIPQSHRDFEEVVASLGHTADGEYIGLSEEVPSFWRPHKIVHMKAGDFALWDSRCVHCNTPAIAPPTAPPNRLLRAVVYVCMTPKSKAEPEVIAERIESYNSSCTTAHWPHKNVKGTGWQRTPPLDFETAPPERKALIIGSSLAAL